jgi:hypothetical protein
MRDLKGADFDTVIVGGIGQKKLKAIPIGFDRLRAERLDMRQIPAEELMNGRRQSHMTSSWDLANSISPLRSAAWFTFR